jgi:poly(3-hydroxybutyrate) depolymerase
MMSANATFDFWADNAGCDRHPSSELLADLDPADHSRAEKRLRRGCAGDTTSVQYVLVGAGHVAPGLPVRLARLVVGESNMDIDAGEVIWAHFASTLTAKQ